MYFIFFFSSRRRHTRCSRDWSSDVCSSDITDGFDQPWTGTVPVGPGLWFSSAKPPQPPVNAQLPGMRPFFLRSADQFRPAPPSAFGSPAYLAALAEVRNISDTRTAEQVNIAMFWAKGAGTSSISGFWNVMATGWIDES